MDKAEFGRQITRELNEQGKVIEGGWEAFKACCLQGAPEVQIEEMRKAYFLGAEHLLLSIMIILDPETEPTEKDLQTMDKIYKELETFRHSLEKELGQQPG